jgi:hypothetical protein
VGRTEEKINVLKDSADERDASQFKKRTKRRQTGEVGADLMSESPSIVPLEFSFWFFGIHIG